PIRGHRRKRRQPVQAAVRPRASLPHGRADTRRCVIGVEALDDLVLLRLERPEKRNALTRPLIAELTDALLRIGSNVAVRGVVLAGAGPRFCAGVDLREFAEGPPETAGALISALAKLCRTVRDLPQPVACAIQGHCLGGALELAACCDFRVCAPDAQLGMPE